MRSIFSTARQCGQRAAGIQCPGYPFLIGVGKADVEVLGQKLGVLQEKLQSKTASKGARGSCTSREGPGCGEHVLGGGRESA